MKRGARPGWAVVFVLFAGMSGCVCGDPVPCGIGSSSRPPDEPRLYAVGEPATFTAFPSLSSCNETTEPQLPDGVTGEVYDPDNQPVPSQTTLGAGGSSATVRFTPLMAGRYHALLSFVPVGSLQQGSLYAARSWPRQAELVRLPVLSCSYVDRTTLGTWICNGMAVRGSDPTRQQVLGGVDLQTTVAGNVVWTVQRDGAVTRFVDTGEKLEISDTTTYSPDQGGGYSNVNSTRLATEDELLILEPTQLRRFTFSETEGLKLASSSFWNLNTAIPLGWDSSIGLMQRSGSRLLLILRATHPTTFEVATRVCAAQLNGAGVYERVPGEECQSLVGDPAGQEEGVLWTSNFLSSTSIVRQVLHRWVLRNGLFVEEGSTEFEGLIIQAAALRSGPALPTLISQTRSQPMATGHWNAAKQTLELELLPAPESGAYPPLLNPRYLWTSSPSTNPLDNAVKVYARETTAP